MADQTESDGDAETDAAGEEPDAREAERGTDARQTAMDAEADEAEAEEEEEEEMGAEDEAEAEAERAREEAIPDDEPEPDTEGDTYGDAREQDNPDAHRDEPPYNS